MSLTLAKALTIPPLNRCRVVAGAGGLHRVVSSMNVVDAPDQGPWLKGGELLFTTGYVFKDNVEDQIRLIRHFDNSGCAGIAVKFKSYLIEPSEHIIQEANNLNFPLIEIPYDLPFSELTLCLVREIVDNHQSENQRIKLSKFLTSLFRGELQGEDLVLVEGLSLGLLPNCDYTVLNISLNTMEKEIYKPGLRIAIIGLIQEMSSNLGVNLLSTEMDDVTVLFQSLKRKKFTEPRITALDIAKGLVQRFNRQFPGNSLLIGVGTDQGSVMGVGKSYRQAREAAYIGRRVASKSNDGIYEYRSLNAYAVIESLPMESRQNYIDMILSQLLQYDKQNDSELFSTLETYLACCGRTAECAQRLHVHRNTVNFRIARVKELLEADLSDGETVFRLQLAMHMARLNA